MALSSDVLKLLERWIGAEERGSDTAEPVFVLQIDLFRIDTQVIEKQYFTDYPYTDPDTDTPMWARLVVPRFTSSLVDGGRLGSFAGIEIGDALLVNDDGTLDFLLDKTKYDWEGRDATLWVGGKTWNFQTGAAPLFEAVPGGNLKVASRSWNQREIAVSFQQPFAEMDRPLQRTLYGGFLAEIDFDGMATFVDVGDEYDIGDRSVTIEYRFAYLSAPSGTEFLYMKRANLAATDDGYAVFVTSGNQLAWQCSDGVANFQINIGTVGEFDDDVERLLIIVVDQPANLITAYVDGVSKGTVDITAMGRVASTNGLKIGRHSVTSTLFWSGTGDEWRFWLTARTVGQVLATKDGTLSGSEDGLAGLFKFDEYGLLAGIDDVVNEVSGPMVRSIEMAASSTDKIDFGNNHDKGAGDSFSFGIWFKTIDATAQKILFGKKNSGSVGDAGYFFQQEIAGEMKLFVSDGVDQLQAGDTVTTNDNTWYGVCGVVDRVASPDEIRLYILDRVGGTLRLAATTDIAVVGSLSNAVSLIAGESANGAGDFSGRLSHAFIYGRVLTTTEIQVALEDVVVDSFGEEANTSGHPGHPEPTPHDEADDLVDIAGSSAWFMRENTGTTIADSIGSVTGTLTGSNWRSRDGTVTKGAGVNAIWVSTLEGGRDIQGKPKQVVMGAVEGAPLQLVDSVLKKYLWSDPALGNGSQELIEARAGGLLLADPADFTVDLAKHLMTLASGASFDDQITANIRGTKDGSTYLKRVGQIVKFVLEKMASVPAAQIPQANMDAFDQSYNYEVGVVLEPSAQTTARQFMVEMLRPRGFGAVLLDLTLRLGLYRDISGETAVDSLDSAHVREGSIERLPTEPPTWKRRLQFRRNWTPITSFSAAVPRSDQERLKREFVVVEDGDAQILTDHANAEIANPVSPIFREKDGAREVALQQAVFKSELDIYRVELSRKLFSFDIGDVVKLTGMRFGLSAGQLFLAVGYDYDISAQRGFPSIALELWGPWSLT